MAEPMKPTTLTYINLHIIGKNANRNRSGKWSEGSKTWVAVDPKHFQKSTSRDFWIEDYPGIVLVVSNLG